MKKVIIVASMKSKFPKNEDIYIGVDRGALYLAKAGILMEEAIGDFDSVSDDEFELIKKYSKNIYRLDSIKDDTDLEVALNKVISCSLDEICIYGALGGRLDHLYANLNLIDRFSGNANIKLVDDSHEIKILSNLGEYIFTPNNYKYHSFFALVDANLSLKGFKYELDHYELRTNDIRCVSNEICNDVAKLILHKGRLLYITSNEVN